MLDLLDKIGISELIIIVVALYGVLRKITGSKLYNDQLREEMAKKEKIESDTHAAEPASDRAPVGSKRDNVK